MIEEIMKHAPKGATHWQAGVDYKENDYGVWSIWDKNEWHSSFRLPDGFMTTIPKSIGFDQGQRFNEQAQHVKDLGHKNDELQKRVDAAQKLIDDWNCGGVNLFYLLDDLEQVLKGENK